MRSEERVQLIVCIFKSTVHVIKANTERHTQRCRERERERERELIRTRRPQLGFPGTKAICSSI